MPIMAKTNNGYKEVKIIKTLNTEVDYILSKVGNTYERIFTVIRELTDVPFLQFKSIKSHANLLNYRIYGNTVNGESVGDRTANLFDGMFEQGTVYESSSAGVTYDIVKHKNMSPTGEKTRVSTIELIPTNGECTLSWNSAKYYIFIVCFNNNKLYQGRQYMESKHLISWQEHSPMMIVDAPYIGVAVRYINDYAEIHPNDLTDLNLMINSGSEPLPYEPYGYRVPVTVTNGTDTQTTNLYLPEQIKKAGNEAEYIDYGEQKQHFADGTSTDVLLPTLPTLSGTNTLSVGTEVQPSKVYVKGNIKY